MLGCNRQDDLDQRWAHLQQLYRGREKEEMELATHAAMYREAGFMLHPPRRLTSLKPTFSDIQQSYMDEGRWPETTSHYTAPSGQDGIERKCDGCGKWAKSRCICGEAFCSYECLSKEWRDHRRICETVKDNSILMCGAKTMYWTGQWPRGPGF